MRLRGRQQGFTLVEVLIVVAIIALLLTAATLTLRNVFKSEMRLTARRTAALMRFAFDRATMTGSYVRIAFDFEKGEIYAEATEEKVSLRVGKEEEKEPGKEGEQKKQPAKKAKKPPALPLFGLGGGSGEEKDGEGSGGSGGLDAKALSEEWEQDLAPPEKPPPSFQRIQGTTARRIRLPKRLTISAVATPRYPEPMEKGIAYVYFFPQGTAEPAIIHFMDSDEDFYSVLLRPLTGDAKVFPCMYKIPPDFGSEDAKRGRSGLRDECAQKGGL
jgi:general secretion pathway protein H